MPSVPVPLHGCSDLTCFHVLIIPVLFAPVACCSRKWHPPGKMLPEWREDSASCATEDPLGEVLGSYVFRVWRTRRWKGENIKTFLNHFC